MGGDYDDSTKGNTNHVGSSRPRSSVKRDEPGPAKEREEGGEKRKKIRKLNDIDEDGKGISLEVSTHNHTVPRQKIYNTLENKQQG